MASVRLSQCLGLVSYFNETSDSYSGSLITADNVNIDEPDVISPRRGFNYYGPSLGGNQSIRVQQVMEYKNILIRHLSDDKLQFDSNNSGTFVDFSELVQEIEEGIRIKFQESNRNLYFTTADGIKVISETTASNINTNSIQNAGVVKAVDLEGVPLFDSTGFLPSQSKVGYRLVYGTKDNNGNLKLGSASPRVVVTNNSINTEINEESKVTFTGLPAGEEYVLLFVKSNDQTTKHIFWFQTGTDEEPQNSDTINAVLYEVDISGAGTALDVANILGNAISSNIPVVSITVDQINDEVNIENTETGNVEDISESTSSTNFSVSTTIQGSVTMGDSANVELFFSLPDEITTRYFYQIYRTPVFTATEDILLEEIEVGDDMYLVLESNITDADIIAGTITVLDDIPESFRENGTPLYMSPNIGEGILRANERPPIAKDLALFRNSMFYANTKSFHSLEMNILTVSTFESGVTEITISNSTSSVTYTAVGSQEESTITTDTRTNTTSNSWILLNSASNRIKYYLFMEKTGSDYSTFDASLFPELAGRQVIIVNLHLYPDTVTGSRDAVIDALLAVSDFEADDTAADEVTVTSIVNGASDDIALGTTSPGGTWAVVVTNQGSGEDAPNREFLLSNDPSVAQSIDETTRSLVRVINRDSLSPVTAQYLSGSNDLPGKIRFEAKNLTDDTFYIATNDPDVATSFNPILPLIEFPAAVVFSAGINSPAQINLAGHGYVSGTELFVSITNTTPAIQGVYAITVLDADNFTIPVNITTEDDPSTTSFVHIPSVESDNLESPNRIYYSKVGQPEAVPILSYIDVGPKDEPIERILALRDNLIVLKTDGIYVVTGSSEPDFSARATDNNTSIIAPDSAVILNNMIYMLSTQGVVAIDGQSSPGIISRVIENKISEVTRPVYSYRTSAFGVAYERDRAYILWLPTIRTDVLATQAYRYNTFERTWTRWTTSATCGLVNMAKDKLYIGDGDENYLLEERKEGDRTDHADKSFILSFPAGFYSEQFDRYEISSVADVAVGDVIFQEQYITIQIFNRLLRKLDLDGGTDGDYEETLAITNGANITAAMQGLIDKLDAEPDLVVTPFIASSDWSTLRDQYNGLIEELNLIGSGTLLKDYLIEEKTYPYEALVTQVNVLTNEIEVTFITPFLEGDFELFKAIKSIVQWNPQHFGNPSTLKQLREGTLMFDQNNFYGGTVAFSSDISQNLVRIPFRMAGTGQFGYGIYGGEKFYFGGLGNDAPFRTYIPKDKQRCRYLNIRFEHANAREGYRCVGFSADVREVSTRAYR